MVKEENLRKRLYRSEIFILKIIPIILAVCCVLNMFLEYLGVYANILTYIAGIGVLPLLFIYLSSFVFKFCTYHRIPIYYIMLNNILCYIDYEFGIPISNRNIIGLHIFIIGIFIILYIIIKFKIVKAQ